MADHERRRDLTCHHCHFEAKHAPARSEYWAVCAWPVPRCEDAPTWYSEVMAFSRVVWRGTAMQCP
jgi:hypothetical protein